jgi:L-lysine exporter family protein LysE/ArgO
LTIVRWLGVAFLTAYGVRSLWRAREAGSLHAATANPISLRAALAQIVALTWLNPHVYLDTVLLIGSIAAHHWPTGKWWFAAGASLASLLWFTGLGYGARLLAPLLSRPRAWQVLDVLIGLTMLAIAAQLAFG